MKKLITLFMSMLIVFSVFNINTNVKAETSSLGLGILTSQNYGLYTDLTTGKNTVKSFYAGPGDSSYTISDIEFSVPFLETVEGDEETLKNNLYSAIENDGFTILENTTYSLFGIMLTVNASGNYYVVKELENSVNLNIEVSEDWLKELKNTDSIVLYGADMEGNIYRYGLTLNDDTLYLNDFNNFSYFNELYYWIGYKGSNKIIYNEPTFSLDEGTYTNNRNISVTWNDDKTQNDDNFFLVQFDKKIDGVAQQPTGAGFYGTSERYVLDGEVGKTVTYVVSTWPSSDISQKYSRTYTIELEDSDVDDSDDDFYGVAAGFGIWDDDKHGVGWDDNEKYYNNSYSSLQDAFDNVKDGGTIYCDLPIDGVSATVPAGKTINLVITYYVGNTDGKPVIINNGTLNLSMSTYSGIYSSDGVCPIENNGTLNIAVGSKFTYDISSLLPEGYKVEKDSSYIWYYDSSSKFNMSKGSIEGNEVEKTVTTYTVLKDVKENTTEVDNVSDSKVTEFVDSNVNDNFNKDDSLSFITKLGDDSVTSIESKKMDDEFRKEIANKSNSNYKHVLKDVDYIWLDVDLYAVDSNENEAQVSELDKEIKVSIYLDDDTLAKLKDKYYYVGLIHDGKTTFITSAQLYGNELVFYSKKFSMYSIITYTEDIVEVTKPTNNNSSSNTQSVTRTEANTPCEEWHNSKNWTWSEKTKACVYRVTNTSSK